MQEYITLEEAIELIAYSKIEEKAERWRNRDAINFFIRTINEHKRVFPIRGKLRFANEYKNISDNTIFSNPKPIPENLASKAFGLKEYGYNAADDFINIAEIRDRNRNGFPIKIKDCLFLHGKGSGLIVPIANSPSFNSDLIFGNGGFLCYADIRIPAADFIKAFPMFDLTTDGNGENQKDVLTCFEKLTETTENNLESLKAENERLKAVLEQKKAEIAGLKQNTNNNRGRPQYQYTAEYAILCYEEIRTGLPLTRQTADFNIKDQPSESTFKRIRKKANKLFELIDKKTGQK